MGGGPNLWKGERNDDPKEGIDAMHTVARHADNDTTPHNMLGLDGLQDTRLSYKARGVLALALSLVDEGESATLSALQMHSDKDGRTAIQSALHELSALGYRTVVRTQQGTRVEWRRSL